LSPGVHENVIGSNRDYSRKREHMQRQVIPLRETNTLLLV
jgi:hypothetical protein